MLAVAKIERYDLLLECGLLKGGSFQEERAGW
jgi:hypothetical protein